MGKQSSRSAAKRVEADRASRKQQEMSEEAKALLEGIVNTEEQAYFCVYTKQGKQLLCLGESYEEAWKRLAEASTFMQLKTFYWHGTRNNEMERYETCIRVSEIVELCEVTPSDWERHVLAEVERGVQQSAARVGLAV